MCRRRSLSSTSAGTTAKGFSPWNSTACQAGVNFERSQTINDPSDEGCMAGTKKRRGDHERRERLDALKPAFRQDRLWAALIA